MSDIVVTDAFVELDSNDISSQVRQVTLNYSADPVENTAMGDSTHTRLGGLKDWNVSLTAKNDFAASQLDSILFPLVGTQVTIKVRPTSSAVGAGNPEYSGTVLVNEYNPMGQSVGDLGEASITLPSAGDLSRDTS